MDPVAVVHAHLQLLDLGQPLGEGDISLVPLRWQGPGPRVRQPLLSLPDALQAGLLRRGPAGLWLNCSSALILCLPGQVIDLEGRSWAMQEPGLLPPHGEARLALQPHERRGSADGAVPDAAPIIPQTHCGAALFVANHLQRVGLISSQTALASYLRGLGVPDWRRLERADPVTSRLALERTRRLFQECRYAIMQTTWSAGAYRTLRLHAPRVRGWALVSQAVILALELTPRALQQDQPASVCGSASR